MISPVMNDKTPGMALLIAQGDEVLLRKGYGLADMETGRKISPDDNLIIASNTKQFTCMEILMLVEAGLLHLDDTVEKLFPDFPEDVKKVTIWEMMVHQSGIKEYFEEDRWAGNRHRDNGRDDGDHQRLRRFGLRTETEIFLLQFLLRHAGKNRGIARAV